MRPSLEASVSDLWKMAEELADALVAVWHDVPNRRKNVARIAESALRTARRDALEAAAKEMCPECTHAPAKWTDDCGWSHWTQSAGVVRCGAYPIWMLADAEEGR